MKYTKMQKSQLAYKKMENQRVIPVLSESKQPRTNIPAFGLSVTDCNIPISSFLESGLNFAEKNINFNHFQDLLIY